MIEVTEDAIKALAQAYLAGWSDHFSTTTPVFCQPIIERTRFFRFLRRQYKDHWDYFVVLYSDDREREQWMKRQVQSFLGIPPEAV